MAITHRPHETTDLKQDIDQLPGVDIGDERSQHCFMEPPIFPKHRFPRRRFVIPLHRGLNERCVQDGLRGAMPKEQQNGVHTHALKRVEQSADPFATTST